MHSALFLLKWFSLKFLYPTFDPARMVMLLGVGCLLSSPAVADSLPSPVPSIVPQAEEAGAGRLTYLFWDVYDARLFAPAGKWTGKPPYALNLTYHLKLKGAEIADRSVQEIRKQGFHDEVTLAAWHGQMRNIFPDVKAGTSLTGIYTLQGETLFYRDGKEIGRIADPAFGQRFFAIWLSEKTSEPELRQALLGL